MAWAQHSTFVLAVGVPVVHLKANLESGLFVDRVSFQEAEAALKSGTYTVLVVGATAHLEESLRVVQKARECNPGIRVIWSTKHAAPKVPLQGELVVAENGRQLVRQLRTVLGR